MHFTRRDLLCIDRPLKQTNNTRMQNTTVNTDGSFTDNANISAKPRKKEKKWTGIHNFDFFFLNFCYIH